MEDEAKVSDLLVRWHRWSRNPGRPNLPMAIFDALVTSLGPARRVALTYRAMNLAAGVAVWSTLRVTPAAMVEALQALSVLVERSEIGEAQDGVAEDGDDAEISVRSEYAAGESPLRVVVSAADRPFPQTTSASSVWAFAAGMADAQPVDHGAEAQPAGQLQVQRLEGITRCVGQAYPQREVVTEEMIERERQRRARQTPPRPTAGYKTRSKKLRKMIGDDDEA